MQGMRSEEMTDVENKCSHKSRHVLLLTNAKGPFVEIFKSKSFECGCICHLLKNNENLLAIVINEEPMCFIVVEYDYEGKTKCVSFCMIFSSLYVGPIFLNMIDRF